MISAANDDCCVARGDVQKAKSFVLLHNVSKRHNVGNLARSCCALGVSEVVLVGTAHYNCFGSQGSDAYVSFKHFPTLEEACNYLKEEKGCEIIGVEIVEGAERVQEKRFRGNTAFMVGNEGYGLTEKQMLFCDRFVYIPQYGRGTASLNVVIASSIVLHEFAVWAQFEEAPRDGYKYLLGTRPLRDSPRGTCRSQSADEIRQERAKTRENASAAEEEASEFSLEF